jgi:hypothetical protein
MKPEYMLLAFVAGWLIRGCLGAYRRRKELKASEIPKVVILGGGGPVPQK